MYCCLQSINAFLSGRRVLLHNFSPFFLSTVGGISFNLRFSELIGPYDVFLFRFLIDWLNDGIYTSRQRNTPIAFHNQSTPSYAQLMTLSDNSSLLSLLSSIGWPTRSNALLKSIIRHRTSSMIVTWWSILIKAQVVLPLSCICFYHFLKQNFLYHFSTCVWLLTKLILFI